MSDVVTIYETWCRTCGKHFESPSIVALTNFNIAHRNCGYLQVDGLKR